jgi:hypothetical protein
MKLFSLCVGNAPHQLPDSSWVEHSLSPPGWRPRSATPQLKRGCYGRRSGRTHSRRLLELFGRSPGYLLERARTQELVSCVAHAVAACSRPQENGKKLLVSERTNAL